MILIHHNRLLKHYLSNMQTTVTSASMVRVPRSWGNMSFVPELHKFYFILDGEGWLSINDQEFSPRAGQLYLIPSGIREGHGTISDHTYLKYFCHFTASIGDLSLLDVLQTPFYIEVSDMERVKRLFQELVHYFRSPDLIAVWKVKALLFELLHYFFEQSGIEKVHLAGALSHEKMELVVQYIEDHLSEPITMNELVSLVHMNPQYFSQLFKSMLGLSPVQYIHELRMEKAKKLLTSTSLSVTDIASTVGIQLHYFSRQFKNQFGFSPLQYRMMFGVMSKEG
ncbi:AraC family transcriptional regulator [Paenibacillus sp. UNC451MF]|uniref:AraC family transcriptional regulator n=1 Tax=Paenibacillus sp. UNC451MF TaxID=1449063 RepID=UPI00056793F1|nr:AraC family transcriptional regulator [Paenibacillus sp. UNC451MF]